MTERQLPHPSTAEAFEWDEHNEAKLARRGILAAHVEDVFLGRPEYKRNKKAGTADWLMIGRDRGGRTLKIGIVWADEDRRVLRAITGWPAQ